MSKQKHVDGISRIENMTNTAGLNASDMMGVLTELKGIETDDTWEEYKNQAIEARENALSVIQSAIDTQVEYEAEQSELKALREAKAAQEKKDYEAQIAKEAAEKATREAEEKAERENKAAEQKLIDAKVAAERAEQAKADAERRAIEAEARAKAKAEADIYQKYYHKILGDIMGFTPGPWREGRGCVVSDSNKNLTIHGAMDQEAKDYYGGYLIGESISSANVRLIAKAPEMYQLLMRIKYSSSDKKWTDEINKLIGDE